MALESTRWARISAGGWLACAALIGAAPAAAISPDSASPARIPGLAPPADVEPGDPFYLFAGTRGSDSNDTLDLRRSSLAEARFVHFGFRNRQIKVIHYATPLRVAQNDMTLKLDAPGAGRAIVSFELEFY